MSAAIRTGFTWGKLAVVVAGGIATVWAVLAMMGASATREWEAYAAAIRAKGQPLTFEEIEARRAVIADEKNSGRIIGALGSELAEHRDGDGRVTLDSVLPGPTGLGDFFDGLHRDQIEDARSFMARRQDVMSRLDAIRDKTTGRFDIQYNQTNPLHTLIPQTVHVRTACKLVRLNSALQLLEGDVSGAVGSVELMSRLSGSLHDEPTLISRLVQIAIQQQAVLIAQDILRVASSDAATLDRMSAELRRMRDTSTLKWAMLGERAFFVETCESMLAGRVPLADVQSSVTQASAWSTFGPLQRLPAFLARSNQLKGAKMLTLFIDAADDPAAALAVANQFDEAIEELSKLDIIVKIMMPSLSRTVVYNVKSASQLDCALAGLAAEKFRLANGRLPNSLDELVPEYLPAVPADPFDDGKPLRMARTAEGIVIYSVDENGIDDGGSVTTRKEKGEKRPLDSGFRLNDASHRGVRIIDAQPADE